MSSVSASGFPRSENRGQYPVGGSHVTRNFFLALAFESGMGRKKSIGLANQAEDAYTYQHKCPKSRPPVGIGGPGLPLLIWRSFLNASFSGDGFSSLTNSTGQDHLWG
jgi:hypothetical protein